MPKSPILVFVLFAFVFCACKTDKKSSYAIRDFRASLQPSLTKIVSSGIVWNYDSSIRTMATDTELVQLGQSELPLLRASAIREMLNRKSFKHFDVVTQHLDDTALIFVDGGEFGVRERTVSDDILQQTTWETQEEKDKTIEVVLTKHNYLKSAYQVLEEIEPREKYYAIIKDMATRPRRLSEDGYELRFSDIEYALFGLAKFKKPGDIEIIRGKMRAKTAWLSFVSFRLMAEFPDTAYFDVLSSYHHRQFYRSTGHSRNGFSGYTYDRADPVDFIQALVMQQSARSALLLDTMLNLLGQKPCFPDKDYTVDILSRIIWAHPCPAYAGLRKKIEPRMREIQKGEITLPMDSSYQKSLDTIKQVIRW